MTSSGKQEMKYDAPPGECTLCDRSCQYYIQDVFFWRLAGPVAPTGKAIDHWIGCINAIKIYVKITSLSPTYSAQVKNYSLLEAKNLKVSKRRQYKYRLDIWTYEGSKFSLNFFFW